MYGTRLIALELLLEYPPGRYIYRYHFILIR